jgi:hypothetical protein
MLGFGALLLAASVYAQGKGGIFPAGTGSKWTYSGSANKQPLTMDAVVKSSKTAGGKTTAVFSWTMNGRPVQEETYIITAAGVSRAKSGPSGAMTINPPIPIVMNPLTVGKSWNWKGKLTAGTQIIEGSSTLKVAARETIKSAAGTFNAFRVDMVLNITAQGQNLKIPNSYWFAPGAGLVRQKATVGPATIEATVSKMQLK